MATSLRLCVISASSATAATTKNALPNVAFFRPGKPSSLRCSAAHNFIRKKYNNSQGFGKTLDYACVTGDAEDPGMTSAEETPDLEEILREIEEGAREREIETEIDTGTGDADTDIQPQTENAQDDE